MRFLFSSLLLATLMLTTSVSAEPRPEHFKGKSADTLPEAVANFSEYNNALEALLRKPSLSPQDLHEVHQLTYTLENALEKIRAELATLADTLEAVHLASEAANSDEVRTQGQAYLSTSRQLID